LDGRRRVFNVATEVRVIAAKATVLVVERT